MPPSRYYKEIFNLISEAVLLIASGEGRILEANRATSEIYGYSHKELLALHNTALSAEPEKTRIATQRQQTEVPFRLHKKKDGTIFPVEISARHIIWHGTEAQLCIIRQISHKLAVQNELRNSGERFRALFDCSSDAIIIADLEGKILDVNREANVRYEYSPDEFIMLKLADINDEDNIPLIIDRIQTLKTKGETVFETVHVAKSGRRFSVEVAARLITIGDEQFILATCRDISERRRIEQEKAHRELESVKRANWTKLSTLSSAHVQAEQELIESRRRLFLALKIAKLGSWEYDAGTSTFTLSDEFYAIYGMSASMMGGFVMPLGRYSRLFIHPDDRDMVVEKLRTGIKSDDPGYSFKIDHRINYASGREGFVSVWVKMQKDSDGRIIHAFGLTQDISEIKRMHQELQDSRNRFSQVAEQSGELIWEVDTAGLYTYVSPNCSQILGYAPEEMVGRLHFYDLFPENVRSDIHIQAMAAFEQQLSFRDFYNQVETKDGLIIDVLTNGVPILDSAGGLLGYRGSDKDISERRRLEQQLAHAQKMESVGVLAGGVAHDFNNKLSVIMGYCELARMELHHPANLLEYLQEINRAAKHSADITARLLAFSRQQITAPRLLDINTIIMEASTSINHLLGCDSNFVFTPAAGLWTVRIDPVQLDQIIMNLTINARDAMPSGGTLTIKTGNFTCKDDTSTGEQTLPAGNYVRVSISDTGTGMDKEILAHIFDPFFTTKEVGKGTGLGLATIYGIITQSSGFIFVSSTPGSGTTFTIYLPCHFDDDSAPVAQPVETSRSKSSGSILLVEDDPAVREVTALLLQTIGFTVVQCSSPYKAISLFEHSGHGIDLVVSDILMPGINGIEMVEQIRDRNKNIKVLFITGYDFDILSSKGVCTDNIDIVRKPINIEELDSTIRHLLCDD